MVILDYERRMVTRPQTARPLEIKSDCANIDLWLTSTFSKTRFRNVTDSYSAHSNTTKIYARSWQLGFAQNIVRTFPRELRDFVYENLILQQSQEEVEVKTMVADSYPHYFQIQYMGFEFVQEISERFYFLSKFKLQHPGEVKGFLEEDRFMTYCKPTRMVTFLTINISLQSFKSCDSRWGSHGECTEWASPKFGTPLKRHFMKAVVDLNGLKKIKSAHNITPTLVFCVDCKEYDSGPKFAEVLVPLVYDLKQNGWTIKFEIAQAKSGVSKQKLLARFNYDVPREDWDKKIQKRSAFVG